MPIYKNLCGPITPSKGSRWLDQNDIKLVLVEQYFITDNIEFLESAWNDIFFKSHHNLNSRKYKTTGFCKSLLEYTYSSNFFNMLLLNRIIFDIYRLPVAN